jgi:vesicle coat complex subunit
LSSRFFDKFAILSSQQDIFRKYPNRYESIIAKLCENLDTLDEPEAKASMIWIIGEYAERIDNANKLLESFLESFQDENTQVCG